MPQPNIQDAYDFVKDSRSKGASNVDIQTALKESGWPSDVIQKAVTGYGDMSGDTFLGESGLQGLRDVGNQLANSGHTINPQDIFNVGKGMVQGQAGETEGAWNSAAQNWHSGNYANAVSDAIEGVPLIGHPLIHGAGNLARGNFGAAAGDLLSLFGPKLAEMGVGAGKAVSEAGGQAMYRSRLPFPGDTSRQDIRGAVNQGIQSGYGAQGLFTPEDKGALNNISVDMKDLTSKIQPYVSGSNGALPTNLSTLFAPFLQKISPLVDSPVEGGRVVAGNMIDEIQPTVRKADPTFAAALYNTDPDNGPVLSMPQRAHLLDMWANGPGRTSNLTVADTHQIRQDAYKTLNASAYSDKATDRAATTRDASKFLAAGAKNATEEIHPEVGPLLEQQHNTMTLQKALQDASKENPKEFEVLKNLVIGGALGAGAGLAGGPGMAESAGAGALGVIALRAAQSPVIATRLGILMGKRFPQIAEAVKPIVMPAGVVGAGMTQGLRSGNDPIQQLFQTKQ